MAETWISYNTKNIIYNNKQLSYLPPYTIRIQVFNGSSPYTGTVSERSNTGIVLTPVDQTQGIWDWTYESSNWRAYDNKARIYLTPHDAGSGNFYYSIIGNGDLSGVTNMRGFCYRDIDDIMYPRYVVAPKNIVLRNLSNVTTMQNAFLNCQYLESVTLGGLSYLSDASAIFSGCSRLQSINLEGIASWLRYTSAMFRDCTSLYNIPFFNTEGVQDMVRMFYGCSSITSVPFYRTSNVTNFAEMFNGCSSLASVPNFDTSKATSLASMFYGCYALGSVPLFNTENVTNMRGMLAHCSSLESIPLFNTSKVTNMSEVCYGCSRLKTVPLFNTGKVTNANWAFRDCKRVESGALALYTQMSSQTNPPSSHTYTFTNCGSSTTTGAAELAQIPTSWGGTMQ